MTHGRYFDRVEVLNLDRRNDRWERLQKVIRSSQASSLQPLIRRRALDARFVKPPVWWKQGAPAWCCYQGHVAALADAANDRLNTILILEDDVLVPSDFDKKLKEVMDDVPSNWEQLYLGGHHLFPNANPPAVIPGRCVAIPYNVNGTFAMAFRGNGILKAYQWLCDYFDFSLWPRHHVDHRLGLGVERQEWMCYCASPFILGHAEGQSNISGSQMKDTFFSAPRTNPSTRLTKVPPIIVLGAFRGGTSLVANVLLRLGVRMGKMAGHKVANPGNPIGSYDAMEDSLLTRWIRDVYVEPRMRPGANHWRRARFLRQWVGLRERRAGGNPWGAKHPTLCLMIDELYEVLGSEWIALTVSRPPEDIYRSHERVKWWGKKVIRQTTDLLLERRNADLLRHKNELRIDLAYNDLVERPQETIEKLCAALPFNPTNEAIKAAVACVRQPARASDLPTPMPPIAIATRPLLVSEPPSAPSPSQTPVWAYWKGPKTALMELCIESLLRHNPSCKLFSEQEFVDSMTVSREHVDRFRTLTPNQQSDFVRSYQLRHHGGYWMDADCIHFRPLAVFDPVLKKHPVFAYREKAANPNSNLCSALIGANKGSRIIEWYHNYHLSLLASGHPLHRIALGPNSLMMACRNVKPAEFIHCVDTRLIMPIHWGWKQNFHRFMTEDDFSDIIDGNSVGLMLTHATCGRFKTRDREHLMNMQNLIGHSLRKSFS